MDYTVTTLDKTCLVNLSGKFTFSDNAKFRTLIEITGSDYNRVEIDMSKISFIDSSGLGMLLLLRDQLQNKAAIVLKNPVDHVRKMFELSRFEHLFIVQ